MDRAECVWDPRSPDVLDDQIAAFDAMRARCPVAHGADGSWTVFTHGDVVAVLDDPATFSNAVSTHLSVPNGMDGSEHGAYRAMIDRYFLPERVEEFVPACRAIARDLVLGLDRSQVVEVMGALAEPFATRVTCAFMGWPASLQEPLGEWIRANHRATLAQDWDAMAEVARAFDGYIREQIDARRARGDDAGGDVTTRLLRERIDGCPLTDEQIVSIVRNWSVGELGTMAASVGIVIDLLARNPDIQARLRTTDDPSLFDAVTDEALRIHPPLISNRRRTTRPVTLSGTPIPGDARVVVLWASANRDEGVFGDPDRLRLDRDPDANLLYGRGVHACPGAGLARLELRAILAELLRATDGIEPAPEAERSLARYPASGFARLPVRLT
jgi:cytochrome P450